MNAPPISSDGKDGLIARFRQVRDFSTRLCRGLQPEDYVVQSMPDVSPTKWHLAHTTWFFETFVVKVWVERYRSEVPQYAYLFNSYYNAAGDMHRRDLRGLISRPTVQETYRYRESIDDRVIQLIEERRCRAPRGNRSDRHARHPSRTATSGIARHRYQTRLRAKPALPRFRKIRARRERDETGAGNISSSSMSRPS